MQKNSEMFKVNVSEFFKGALYAVGAAVFMYMADLLKVPGFDYYNIPWSEILRVAMSTFMGYVMTKFFSTPDGKVFGKI